MRSTRKPRRMAAVWILVQTALLGGAGVVLADVVHLESGKAFEGELLDPGPSGQVRIRVSNGSILGFPPEDVARVERRASPIEQFDRRLARVEAGELEPLVALLVLARERRLRGRDEKVAGMILRIDPNHELARWTLGWVVFENRWVREDELRRRKDLVKIGGEWMTAQERERRRREKELIEVRELISMLQSENKRIRAYSVSELSARLRRREPATVAALVDMVSAPGSQARKLALTLLLTVRIRGVAEARRLDAKRAARALQRQALREKEPAVLALIERNVRSFWPRESFVAALEAARTVTEADEVERLAVLIEAAVQKRWMRELCAAVSDRGQRPAVRRALERILGRDLGYDVARWQALWEARAAEFRDVE